MKSFYGGPGHPREQEIFLLIEGAEFISQTILAGMGLCPSGTHFQEIEKQTRFTVPEKYNVLVYNRDSRWYDLLFEGITDEKIFCQ